MKAENFCFWLQGFFEIKGGTPNLTAEQIELIKVHLALVFKHDPTMAHEKPKDLKDIPKEIQKRLDDFKKEESIPERRRRGYHPGVLYC